MARKSLIEQLKPHLEHSEKERQKQKEALERKLAEDNKSAEENKIVRENAEKKTTMEVMEIVNVLKASMENCISLEIEGTMPEMQEVLKGGSPEVDMNVVMTNMPGEISVEVSSSRQWDSALEKNEFFKRAINIMINGGDKTVAELVKEVGKIAGKGYSSKFCNPNVELLHKFFSTANVKVTYE